MQFFHIHSAFLHTALSKVTLITIKAFIVAHYSGELTTPIFLFFLLAFWNIYSSLCSLCKLMQLGVYGHLGVRVPERAAIQYILHL